MHDESTARGIEAEKSPPRALKEAFHPQKNFCVFFARASLFYALEGSGQMGEVWSALRFRCVFVVQALFVRQVAASRSGTTAWPGLKQPGRSSGPMLCALRADLFTFLTMRTTACLFEVCRV